MDELKVTDNELRLTAMDFAVRVVAACAGNANLMALANEIYNFLKAGTL